MNSGVCLNAKQDCGNFFTILGRVLLLINNVRSPTDICSMRPCAQIWDEVFAVFNASLDALNSENGPKPNRKMCRLLILGEDRRIAAHIGADPIALCRSLWKTIVCGEPQGGSTIAMQLVRTITGRYQRTVWRKLTEILLAIQLTNAFDRADIARVYLWLAYYGWNMHGFEQACSQLEICPDTASDLDCALLVACLKYPQPKNRNSGQIERIHRRARHLVFLEETRNIGLINSCVLNRGTFSNS